MLEFECTNNIVEYEALIRGMKKALDLNVQQLMVFKRSNIIVKHVKDEIHYVTPHI